MPRNSLWIFIIIGGLALFVFSRKNSESPQFAAKSPNESSSVPVSNEPSILAEATSELPTRLEESPEVKRALALSASERMIGMRRLDIRAQNAHWHLTIQLKSSKKNCELGDLDLIRIDQGKRDQKGLIFSIEDLANREVLSKVLLALEDIVDNKTLSFSWPDSGKDRSLGLFLCSASQSKDSCQSKSVQPINNILTNRNAQLFQDKVYLFHYLQQSKVLSFLNPVVRHPDLLPTLQKILQSRGMDRAAASRVSSNIDEWHKALGSAAPEVEDRKKLIINLPHNDPACPLPHLQF